MLNVSEFNKINVGTELVLLHYLSRIQSTIIVIVALLHRFVVLKILKIDNNVDEFCTIIIYNVTEDD